MTAQRPQLRGSRRLASKGDGWIWVFSELSNRRLRIEDPQGVAAALFAVADGGRPREEVVSETVRRTGADADEVRGSLHALEEAGLIEDAAVPPPDLPPGYLAAYRRNAFYFSEFEDASRTRSDMLVALHRAKVGILGLGGTSSWVASGLLAAGVGTVRGIDFDVVGPENLGRQILYRSHDVGKTKVRAMEDEFADFNPAIRFEGREGRIRSVEDVRSFVEGLDFLVVGCGTPRFLLYRWVNEACLAARVPYILVQTRQIGPLVVPGKTACYRCLEGTLRDQHPAYDAVLEASFRTDAAGHAGPPAPGEGPLRAHAYDRMPQFGPMVAYAGIRASIEVVRHIVGLGNPETRDGVLALVEPNDYAWSRFEVPKLPDCPACSAGVAQAD